MLDIDYYSIERLKKTIMDASEVTKDLSGAKYDTLVLASDRVEVDETDSEIYFDASDQKGKGVSAHLGLCDVDEAVIDQSRSTIRMKGGSGSGINAVNHIDGCSNLIVNQHDTEAYVQAGKNSEITAVNYVSDTAGYLQLSGNSKIVVDGRGSKGGIVAHTVIGKNANVTIRSTNSVTIIRG